MSGRSLHFEPDPQSWAHHFQKFDGDIFNTSFQDIRHVLKKELGIPTEKKAIVVGHQPTLFHPGIAAKFMAASALASQVDGIVVHLVVDHFDGDVGLVETPQVEQDVFAVKSLRIAETEKGVPLVEQPRGTVVSDCAMGNLLSSAEGQHAAAQFANAMQQYIQPYADVHATVYSSELLHSAFGQAFVKAMRTQDAACRTAYNNAAFEHPNANIALLDEGELPIWETDKGTYPKAILLTSLARLGFADLFVHGLGGATYDVVMEEWIQSWLGIELVNAVSVSADVHLVLNATTIEQARQSFAVPKEVNDEVSTLVQAIENAAPYSPERKQFFAQLQELREAHGVRPDVNAMKQSLRVANKRDWPLFCYSATQLQELQRAIEFQFQPNREMHACC